jgi:hypothetical protein
MNEIVKLRKLLTPFLKKENAVKRSAYHFKSNAIKNSIYGVDIDAGAVEIAKLRLWLSMVVDEERIDTIEPLPNLEYKIVQGNSLINIPDGTAINDALATEIEKLTTAYFHFTDKEKKQEQKQIIDAKIQEQLQFVSEMSGYVIDFDFRLLFHDVWRSKNGFDIVLGNPPYIGQKGNKDLFEPLKNSGYFEKQMDYWYFFIHKSYEITKNTGVNAFITSSYWLTANGAKKIRDKIVKKYEVKEYINFNNISVFYAGVHTNLFFLKKENPLDNFVKVTNYINEYSQNILLNRPKEQNFSVSQNLIYSNWTNYVQFLPEKTLNVFDKIIIDSEKLVDDKSIGVRKKGIVPGKTIRDGICEISPGIETGKDRYIDNENNRNEGVYILKPQELKELNLSHEENRKVKPFYKNSDIFQYYVNDNPRLFFLYVNDIEDKATFLNYPRLFNHFSKYKEILDKRAKNGVLQSAYNKGKWWALKTDRPSVDFNNPKIVCPQRSHKNTFGYAPKTWYAASDVFYIGLKKNSYSLKYILSILNSSLIYFWLYYMGKRKGNALELIGEPLQFIPIKEIDRENQKPFTLMIDYILFLKSLQNNKMSFYFEQLIDGMVYELYFDKEIKQTGCDILKYLTELPEIKEEMQDEEKLKIITKVFNKFYDQESPVRKSLFFMDSVEEVAIIKKSLEK